MSSIYYRAVDQSGNLHSGRLSVPGKSALESQLASNGLRLVRAGDWHWQSLRMLAGRQARYPSAALSLLTFHLAHLLQAGVPLLSALDELAVLESRTSMRAALRDIRERVDCGEPLSDALQAWPDLFDAQYVAVVAAGEASGQLALCLVSLEKSLRWQDGVAQRLKTLLIYPAFAALLLVGVVCFLFGFVVPSLVEFLSFNGRALPWHTEMLINLSHHLQRWGVQLAMGIAACAGLIVLWVQQTSSGRYWRDRFLLSCKPGGQLLADLWLARYAQSTALLYRNGVDLIEALTISGRIVGNLALRAELSQAHQRVLEGSAFANALSDVRWAPSTLVRLVAAGESAGTLAQALSQAGEQLHMRAGYSVDRIERLVSPILLSVIGGLLLWVVVSVVLPVYDAVMDVGALS